MDYELGPHGEKDERDPCHQVHSRWELRPFSTFRDPRLEGRVREGEAQSFLLSGRGRCQEEETRKDFLEDAWMNDHGKRRRGLPGQRKEHRQKPEAERQGWAAVPGVWNHSF